MIRLTRGEQIGLGVVLAVPALTLLLVPFAQPDRGPAGLAWAETTTGGHEVWIAVHTCHGSPEVAEVREDASQVTAAVVSDVQTRDHDGCADVVTARLRQPLGARPVIDAHSGTPVRVEPIGVDE